MNATQDLFPEPPEPEKPKRPPVLYRVRGTPVSAPCRFCPGRIVWMKIEGSGATMPLSWASREAWIENGRQVGLIFQPHFADCPNWPKRSKKKGPP